ncbi:RNA 2',3'-cyclic phosphodiesterase [Fontivita pretiosa]|uniref:RNA 2',3'-cyclic phosphodiesterase n=1 Tax=Fontivita pretiosa TaxID=2989684 RepID=UPI003D172C79
MRLFIAIELPPEVRQHLLRVGQSLKSQIGKASFTREQNLHITLKFLGEVEDRRVAKLTESLSLVRAGGTIEIFARKIECFPERGPVRIVAAGFGGDLEAIGGLHRAIEQRCQHLGFERETRAYRPHVTLARARPTLPPEARQHAEALTSALFPGPRLQVARFVLMESHLHPEGSRYVPLAHFQV